MYDEKQKAVLLLAIFAYVAITDFGNILTAEQEDRLMAILTIPALDGQTIEEHSFQTAQATGLGRENYNDGVLITIVYKERQVRIEVGTGLEKVLRDDVAAKIIREDIAPAFARQAFAGALYAALQTIEHLPADNGDNVGKYHPRTQPPGA